MGAVDPPPLGYLRVNALTKGRGFGTLITCRAADQKEEAGPTAARSGLRLSTLAADDEEHLFF